MHPLIESLIKEGPAVTDGSWGTQMQKRGLTRGQNPDSWNLSHADQVREVAQQYVDAGSRIILTNTFGASRLSLANFKLADKAVDINTAGADGIRLDGNDITDVVLVAIDTNLSISSATMTMSGTINNNRIGNKRTSMRQFFCNIVCN